MMMTVFAIASNIAVMALPATHTTSQAAIENAVLEEGISAYLRSRLVDPRGATVSPKGEPYRVSAVIEGAEWRGWARDVSLRMRLGANHRMNTHRQTVLFSHAGPVAVKADVTDFTRLD